MNGPNRRVLHLIVGRLRHASACADCGIPALVRRDELGTERERAKSTSISFPMGAAMVRLNQSV